MRYAVNMETFGVDRRWEFVARSGASGANIGPLFSGSESPMVKKLSFVPTGQAGVSGTKWRRARD